MKDKKETIYIPSPDNYSKLREAFIKDGPGSVHVLSDFDNTLVKAYINGIRVPSLIALIRDGNYLTSDYAKKAQALYNQYAPIELDATKTMAQKKASMEEWWKRHFDLLIKSGLNVSDIERVIASDQTNFREEAKIFFNLLRQKNIPLVIVSASGLGADAISLFFKRNNQSLDNIYIVSNRYKWDEIGSATAIIEPIIHSMNKDETTLGKFPFYEKIKDRKNVILVGDSLSDTSMVSGFQYQNLVKFGFLNERVEEQIIEYQEEYDVVIPDDGSFNAINDFLIKIK